MHVFENSADSPISQIFTVIYKSLKKLGSRLTDDMLPSHKHTHRDSLDLNQVRTKWSPLIASKSKQEAILRLTQRESVALTGTLHHY